MKANAHRSRLGKFSRFGIILLLVLVAGLLGVFSTQRRVSGGPAGAQAQPAAASNISATSNPPHFQPTNQAVTATPQTNAGSGPSSLDALKHYRLALLRSQYGTNRIEDLLKTLAETPGGPEIQLIFQALALRKQEALPVIKAKLRTGEMWEKHMLTKFLRLCPWPETKDELVALARAVTEHWLPRQDGVFALGSLGDPSVGPDVVALLNSPKAPLNLQMAAVSTLARIRFADAVPAITPFTQAENIHLRLFATRALAELGATVDRDFLLSSLRSEDYVVRQEASETLWKIGGQDVTDALRAIAKNDFNEAVRDGASQALLRREMDGRNPAEKADILRKSLDNVERLTALWILRTALEEAGIEGRSFVETVTSRDDFLGERACAYLILADSTPR